MSVFQTRDKIISYAEALLGVNERDGTAWAKVLNAYNKEVTPLPRAYSLSPGDAWCAAYVSLVMHRAGVQEFPFECGVADMWKLAKQKGLAIKGRKPMFGDVAVYTHSHVGIVYTFQDGELTTIEGNANDSCMKRATTNIGKFRGFFRPYIPGTREVALECIKGVYGNDERDRLLAADGYSPDEIQQEVNNIMHAFELVVKYGLSLEDKELEAMARGIYAPDVTDG